jgi:hypothetical protein
MAERITRSYPIGSERFWSIYTSNFEIQNLYAENIIFAYSLPISTSTWHSDYCNGPGGYISGELKSKNINMEKPPVEEAIIHHRLLELSHQLQLYPKTDIT